MESLQEWKEINTTDKHVPSFALMSNKLPKACKDLILGF